MALERILSTDKVSTLVKNTNSAIDETIIDAYLNSYSQLILVKNNSDALIVDLSDLNLSGETSGGTNNYVTSVSFNTADGTLTLNRNELPSLTVDLDGRYLLASEYEGLQDLQSVTDEGNTTTNHIQAKYFESKTSVGGFQYLISGGTAVTVEFENGIVQGGSASTTVFDNFIQGGESYTGYISNTYTQYTESGVTIVSLPADYFKFDNGNSGYIFNAFNSNNDQFRIEEDIIHFHDIASVNNFGEFEGSKYIAGVLEIKNGLIHQKDLSGGGAPQSLIIKTASELYLSGSTGYIQMDYNGLTKFSNRQITGTTIAGFSNDGYLGELTLGQGIAIENNVITITGTTNDAGTPTLQQVTDVGATTNNTVVFNNNIQVNTRVFGNSSTLKLSSENSALAGEVAINSDSIQMRTNGQSVMTVSTGFTQINSDQLILPDSVRWDKNLASTKMLVLGTNNLITTQDIPSFQNTDNYITGATYSGSILTLNRQNGNVTVSIPRFSENYNDLFNKPFENFSSSLISTSKDVLISNLAGTGTRMVVALPDGTLSVQSIPSGGGADGNNYVTGSTFNTGTGVLTLNRQNGSVTVDLDGRYSTTDTNNYANSLSFDTGTGILSLGRSGLSTLTVDLDGRYSTGAGGGSINSYYEIGASNDTTVTTTQTTLVDQDYAVSTGEYIVTVTCSVSFERLSAVDTRIYCVLDSSNTGVLAQSHQDVITASEHPQKIFNVSTTFRTGSTNNINFYLYGTSTGGNSNAFVTRYSMTAIKVA